MQDSGEAAAAAVVDVIPRSREVGQSWLTSNFTTLQALAPAAFIVLRRRPRLLLVNGPGTCIPICAAAFVFRRAVIQGCVMLSFQSRVAHAPSSRSTSGPIQQSNRCQGPRESRSQ